MTYNKSANLFVYYCTLFLPITFIIGSFFVNFISIIISLFTLFFFLRFKKFSFYYNKPYNFFFILFVLFLVSSGFSDYKLSSLENSFSYLLNIFLFIGLSLFILDNDEKKFQLSKIVFLLVILLCIDSFFQKIFGFNLIGYPVQQAGRLTSFFKDEQIPGSIIFKLSPFVIYYIYQEKNKIMQNCKYIVIFFVYFSILLSGERSASVLSTLAIFIILNFNKLNKKLLFIYSTFFLIIFMILFNMKNSVIKERLFYTIEQSKNNVYLSLYNNSLNIFKKNIFVGTGPQSYRYECAKISKSCSNHPHNFVLELLSDTGLFSPLFFFISLLSIIFYKIKQLKDRFIKSVIVSYSILFFFPLIPTGSFFTSFHMTLTWFTLGFLFSLKNIKLI
jgi:O-antigen ligase